MSIFPLDFTRCKELVAGRLHVDGELEFGPSKHRQIARLGT